MSPSPARHIPWFSLLLACAIPVASPWLYPRDWLVSSHWSGLILVFALVLVGRLVSGGPWLGIVLALAVDAALFVHANPAGDPNELPTVAMLVLHCLLMTVCWRAVFTRWFAWRRWLLLLLAFAALSILVWTFDHIDGVVHVVAGWAGLLLIVIARLRASKGQASRWNVLAVVVVLLSAPLSGAAITWNLAQTGATWPEAVIPALLMPVPSDWTAFWLNETEAVFDGLKLVAVLTLAYAGWRALRRGRKQSAASDAPTAWAPLLYLVLTGAVTIIRLPSTLIPVLVWWLFLLVFLAFVLLQGIAARIVLKPPEQDGRHLRPTPHVVAQPGTAETKQAVRGA